MVIIVTGMNTTIILLMEPTPIKTAMAIQPQEHTLLIIENIEKTSQVFLTFIDFYFMFYFKW